MGGRREVQGVFCAFERCFLYFFFVVGLRAGTKTNVNIVILLFDSNRPNLNQGLRYYLIPGLYFSVFNIWLLFLKPASDYSNLCVFFFFVFAYYVDAVRILCNLIFEGGNIT